MAFIIRGPHPSNTKQVVLPNPALSNTESITSNVQTIRMMDGSLRTYVKRKDGRRRFRWDFLVGVNKAKELEDYALSHAGSLSTVAWRENLLGYLTLNPIDFNGQPREVYTVTLEFEEK